MRIGRFRVSMCGGRWVAVASATIFALGGTGLIAASGLIAAGGGDQGLGAAPAGAWAAPATSTGGQVANAGLGEDSGTVAGRIALSPVAIELVLVPRKPRAKGPIEVRASVLNLSAARVPQLVLSLTATPSSLIIRPAEQKEIRNLAPARSADQTWSICSTTGGTFQLAAHATTGATTAASAPITVILAPSARC